MREWGGPGKSREVKEGRLEECVAVYVCGMARGMQKRMRGNKEIEEEKGARERRLRCMCGRDVGS